MWTTCSCMLRWVKLYVQTSWLRGLAMCWRWLRSWSSWTPPLRALQKHEQKSTWRRRRLRPDFRRETFHQHTQKSRCFSSLTLFDPTMPYIEYCGVLDVTKMNCGQTEPHVDNLCIRLHTSTPIMFAPRHHGSAIFSMTYNGVEIFCTRSIKFDGQT